MFTYPLKFRNTIIPNYMMNENSEIYSYNSNKVLSPYPNKEGRLVVMLLVEGVKKMIRLDYLVISTLGTYHDDIIRLIHLDDDILNCKIENLMQVRKVDIINKYKEMYHVDDLKDIEEEWKVYQKIPSIEVSNFGGIRNSNNKLPIKTRTNSGYIIITIGKDTLFVHRLVAELFIPNPKPDEYFFVNHLDGNKSNNIFYNLEWCNISINAEHAYLTGLSSSYSDEDIHNVCKLLQDGLPHVVIEEITGINRKMISDIYRGRRRKNISSQYTFKKRIPLSELYNGDAVFALIKSGYKAKEISSLLKINYNQSFISFYERLKRKL